MPEGQQKKTQTGSWGDEEDNAEQANEQKHKSSASGSADVGEEQKGGRNAEATQSRKGKTSTEPTEESMEKHESVAGHMTLQDKMDLVRKKGSVEGIEFSEKEWKLVNNRFTQTALPKANAEVQQHFI